MEKSTTQTSSKLTAGANATGAITETLKGIGWLLLALLVFALLSCAGQRGSAPTVATMPPASPLVLGAPEAAASSGSPHYLRVKLTINTTADLRVKAGDKIEVGALLSDRAFERERLVLQRRALALSVQRIGQQSAAAHESIKLLEQLGAELPPVSFATEQAAIRRAEVDETATARKVSIQRQRREALPAVAPVGFDGAAIEAHESVKLALVEDEYSQRVADVALAEAKLTSAQQARQLEEKRAHVDYARQMLTARAQLQQTEIARAQITAQIAGIDAQLAQLVAVRAPFSGTIKRIEWEEMNDAQIFVSVTLAVDGQ